MIKRFLIGFVFLSFVFLYVFAQAQTFNVTNPREIQQALTTAQNNGESDTINVAAGTYNIASTLTFDTTENHDLTVVGAGTSATVLDGGDAVQILNFVGTGGGDIHISGMTLQNGRNGSIGAVGGALFIDNSGDGSVCLDQCAVTGSSSAKSAGGARIGAVNGDITVTNSSFTHNTCDEGTADDGCGLYLYFDTENAAGNATVQKCNISNNTLNHNQSPIGNCDGAGMMIYHLGSAGPGSTFSIENNTFNNNLSYEGVAGVSLHLLNNSNTVIITGNTFSGNIAGPLPEGVAIQIYGGGLHGYIEGGNITISDNKFLDNQILDPFGLGAGMCLDPLSRGTLRMVGNVFAGNRSAGMGGGAYVTLGSNIASANIVQNLFVNNQAGTAEGSGGGLSLAGECDVTLINNTFYGNSASDGGAMTYYAESASDQASVYNGIYWGNTPNQIAVYSAGPVAAQYSNIQGGTGESWFGPGCIDSLPGFFDKLSPRGADGIFATLDDGLHLDAGSPSMNQGNNGFVPGYLATDIAGQRRIQDGTVDMGSYEGLAGTSPITPCTDCGGYDVTISNKEFDGNTKCECTATHSITLGDGVTVRRGATVIFEIEQD